MKIHYKLLLSTILAATLSVGLMLAPALVLLKSSILDDAETRIEQHLYKLNSDLKQLVPLSQHQLILLAESAELQALIAAEPNQLKQKAVTTQLNALAQRFIEHNPLFNELALLANNHTQLAWAGSEHDPFKSFTTLYSPLVRKATQPQNTLLLIPYQDPHSRKPEKWVSYQFKPLAFTPTDTTIPQPALTLIGKIDDKQTIAGHNHIYIDKRIHIAELNRRMGVISGGRLVQSLTLQSWLQSNRALLSQQRVWKEYKNRKYGLKLHRLNGGANYLSVMEHQFLTDKLRLAALVGTLITLPALILIIIWLRIKISRDLQEPLSDIFEWVKNVRYSSETQAKYHSRTKDVEEIKQLVDAIDSAIKGSSDERNKLISEAHTDHYTGLANERGLNTKLNLLSAEPKAKRKGSLLHIRIRRFFSLADRASGRIAENVLMLLIQRLQREANRFVEMSGSVQECTFYRLKQDELAILTTDTDQQHALNLAVALKKAATRQIHYHGHATELDLVFGLAQFDSNDTSMLRHHAKQALDAAEQRSPSIVCYNHEIAAHWERISTLEKLISKSDFNSDLQLTFQPIIDAKHLKIAALEAVVNFKHTSGVLASTTELLNLATQTGRIVELDTWVATEAIRTLSLLVSQGNDDLPIAINASTSTFCSPEYIAAIEKCLNEYEHPGERLTIELNESSLLSEQKRVIQHAETLYVYGVGVSIDNLGTDSTSLAVLRELPLHSFKISADIISELGKSSAAENVIDIAHIFNIPTIATGVETEYQERRLRELQCSHLQGPRFYPALSFEKLKQII